ncbi:hypothetical protein BGZ50_007972 [Haplosporangium sp. Z 11]|nr:hypothetical protein BGZ50_007972 [Haplosporangium sp. Z 11]
MTVPMTVVAGDATAAASVTTADPTTSGEVVKKKKGPKKGTKYKKRTPAGPDGKVPKKMTKKAAAAAAAAAEAAAQEAALQAQRQTLNFGGRLGPMNTRVDMEHPLETFKWPYSPFTNEFKAQHRARDKMITELHQAVEEITIRNGQASWHLQELDNQLQQSRQDLRTSLDEIQFRKSQLRDMSLLAVDIVRKLSSSSTATQSSSSALSTSMPTGRRISASSVGSSSGAISGNESGAGEGGYVSSSAASYLDGDQMDVDDAESGGEQHLKLRTAQPQQALKGLNEGNVRSFLEKIRELEQTQRHAAA